MLTKAQERIIELYMRGANIPQIAQILGKKVSAVGIQMYRAKQRAGAQSLAELVLFYKHGQFSEEATLS